MSHTSLPHNVIHNECMTGYELNTQYNFILKQVYPPPPHKKTPKIITSKLSASVHIYYDICLKQHFKSAKICRKMMESEFPGICTSTHCVLNTYIPI